LLADALGIALQVVLATLSPAERLAFVLHDMFAMPFHEIAAIADRSPEATRQLASRARRRVHDAAPPPDPDMIRQRAVIDAYFDAVREGDLEALVAVLDPDVVLRAHRRARARGRALVPRAGPGSSLPPHVAEETSGPGRLGNEKRKSTRVRR
jgi:hypothetical protein